jgi:hypothetical protein
VWRSDRRHQGVGSLNELEHGTGPAPRDGHGDHPQPDTDQDDADLEEADELPVGLPVERRANEREQRNTPTGSGQLALQTRVNGINLPFKYTTKMPFCQGLVAIISQILDLLY